MSALTPTIRLARKGWRRLISMRTALVLLFLLALAAVPGSLLPQRPLNPSKVDSYLATHGWWGHLLDHVGAFDVFGSVWFAAIYLLLFVSLIGCLVPRIRMHAKGMLRKPLPAPENLSRLPESAVYETSAESVDAAASTLRSALGRRWRTVRRTEASGAITISAEKGYSRETGNLIFHIAVLLALVLIAVGRLYTYQGSIVVSQGTAFCNTVAEYDSWKPGRLAQDGKISPAGFCVDDLTKFTATYLADGEPSQFAADITYHAANAAGQEIGPQLKHTITVNHPLRYKGDRLYLIGHGFTPQVTVTMPDGQTRTTSAAFIPQDATTYFSEGALKYPGPIGANQDIGLQGSFAPDPLIGTDGRVSSAGPIVNNPVLSLFAYEGSLYPDANPQSVYSLNTTKMTQLGQPVNLQIGQTASVGKGVTVRFDGYVPWASLQVSHDPTQGYLLIVAVAMVVGLIGSLSIRRRRIWLRITPGSADEPGSPTVVSVGGLARSDSGNFTTEFAGLLSRLQEAQPPSSSGTPALARAGKE